MARARPQPTPASSQCRSADEGSTTLAGRFALLGDANGLVGGQERKAPPLVARGAFFALSCLIPAALLALPRRSRPALRRCYAPCSTS